MDLYGPGMTALRAHSTKLAVAAHNVANLSTPGFKAQRVHMVEVPGGGVTVTISRDLSPGPPLREQDEGRSKSGGIREGSNVDLAREMVDLITSQRGYQANARAVKTLAEIKGQVLDIIG